MRLCKCKLPRHLSVSQILFLSCPSVSQLIVFPPPITTTTPKAADVGTAEWAITRFVLHGGRRRREGRTHCEGGKGLAPKPWFFPGGAQRELIFRDEIFEVGEKLVGAVSALCWRNITFHFSAGTWASRAPVLALMLVHGESWGRRRCVGWLLHSQSHSLCN